ncbi:ATP-dependent DNA ligase, partial [Mesorhizobium sp. P17.1]|nr:ATP-dependent DNA ligase [Mesorhizobium sp. P17.1]
MARSPTAAPTLPLPAYIEPCLPKQVAKAPSGPRWVHEIKHDGYRLAVRIDAGEVRLVTRRGLDWTKRFPLVVRAAAELDVRSAYLGGEVVV